MCSPEWGPLHAALNGASKADATYVIQKYIAEGLRVRGHQLTLVAPQGTEEIFCMHDNQIVTPAALTWSSSRWFSTSSKVTWRAQRLLGIPYLNLFSNYRLYDACLRSLPGHDIVYERNGLFKYGVAKACRTLGLPYVLYFEADDILEHDLMGKPILGLQRRRAEGAIRTNLATADCVICVSEPLKRQLMTQWQVPDAKIAVFPNVADVTRFRPDAKARREIRKALGMPTNPLLVFVGNFYIWHDVVTLLDAFADVIQEVPEARLVLVGDGAQRPAMIRHAAHLGLEDAVRFTGMVPHDAVPAYLAAADVAVVPYPLLDTPIWLSPLKLYEYMAAGKAIVASAVGQLIDVVDDGRNGLLIPPGDVRAMAAALQRLLCDAPLRARLGAQARQDAVLKHSWARYIDRLERLFAGVIEGRTPADL